MLAELGKHDITLDDMDIFLEIGNAEAIVKTVEAGFGVSFVSHLAAACALERGGWLRFRSWDFGSGAMSIWSGRDGRQQTGRLKRFGVLCMIPQILTC